MASLVSGEVRFLPSEDQIAADRYLSRLPGIAIHNKSRSVDCTSQFIRLLRSDADFAEDEDAFEDSFG